MVAWPAKPIDPPKALNNQCKRVGQHYFAHATWTVFQKDGLLFPWKLCHTVSLHLRGDKDGDFSQPSLAISLFE